jgi:uncharacterized membrane protein YccC
MIVRWFQRHDPEWYALHKAIKVAVAVTVGLAIGTLIGNPQLSLFASFGGVAMLLFADFPGGQSARLGAYLALFVMGAVLIVLGTLASTVAWLAVLGMAVVGFGVLFSGVLSAASAAATRALLLTFILPVTIPATLADVPARLGGWSIAAILAIPAAVLVWPPREHDKLRARAAEACAALAQLLKERASPDTTADAPDPVDTAAARATDASTQEAIEALRHQFRSTTFRPVGLTTGSRLLMQLPDRLEWLRAVAQRIPAGTADPWPPRAVELVRCCGAVLQSSADVLATAAHRPTYETRQRLTGAMRELDQLRAQVSDFLQVVTDVQGPGHAPTWLPPSVAHELAYTTHLAGHTVAVSAAADARPLLDRLLGRQAPGSVEGPVAAAHRLVAGHITRRSVWFQNSVRGGLGLSIAVLLAEVTEIAHGFWVVLAAMSVLRTTALTTGSTALRALAGTLVGFLAGAGIILLVGVTPWHLWVLLPFVVVVAAYLPEAVSFAAGQAAFTVMVVILFNIIAPVGWTVGLVRIEDIALGCAAGLISGVLLWPRGAAGQIRRTLSDYYQRSADALETAVDRLTGHALTPKSTLDDVISDAKAAGYRLDDAFREYLFERGSKPVPLAELTTVSNGANRIRLAAEAVAMMAGPVLPVDRNGAEASDRGGTEVGAVNPLVAAGDPGPPQVTLGAAGVCVSDAASGSARWFRELADLLEQPAGTSAPPPAVCRAEAEDRLLETFRERPDALADTSVLGPARTLWGASLYVDDVTRMQQRLIASVNSLNERRAATPDPAAVAS